MISNDAIDAAFPLMYRFTDRGLHLKAKEGTPLARLASAARLDTLKELKTLEGQDKPDMAPYISNTTSPDGITQINLHDVCQAEILDVAIRAVRGHLTIARTLVAPAVESLVMGVRSRLASTPVNELLDMNVSVESMPRLLEEGTILNLINELRDTQVQPPNLVMRLPMLEFDQVIDLMKTGNAEVDNQIEMWAKVEGPEVIMPIFDSMFRIEGDKYNNFTQAAMDQTHGLTAMLVCFLIGRKLAAGEVIEGIAMSKDALVNAALDYRNSAGQRLAFVLDRANQQTNQGLLVLSNTRNSITVNKPVYDKWLKEGGSNEVLFGLLLQPSMRYYLLDIGPMADKLKSDWERFVAMKSSAESAERFAIAIRVLRQVFFNDLNDGSPVDDTIVQTRAAQLAAFDRELESVSIADLEDIPILALKLICRSQYPDTDAEPFLLQMVELQKQNPGLPVAEIALLASIDYVACYMANQLIVTD